MKTVEHLLVALTVVRVDPGVCPSRLGVSVGKQCSRYPCTIHSGTGPRVLVHPGVTYQSPSRPGGAADVVRLRPRPEQPTFLTALRITRPQPVVPAQQRIKPVARVAAEPLVFVQVHADRKAGEAVVAGEHVGQLVAEQGELRAVGRSPVRCGEVAHVLVVEGTPAGMPLAVRRGNLAGNLRSSTVRSYDQAGAHRRTVAKHDTSNATAPACQCSHSCRGRNLSPGPSRSLEQRRVQGRAAY